MQIISSISQGLKATGVTPRYLKPHIGAMFEDRSAVAMTKHIAAKLESVKGTHKAYLPSIAQLLAALIVRNLKCTCKIP
jgi:hypothetical protein